MRQPSEATKPIQEYTFEELLAAAPIAVLDEPDSTEASLAMPTSIRNNMLHVHYYVTRGRSWDTAVFTLGFQETKSRRTKILMRPPTSQERGTARPYSGTLPLDPELVVATGLKFKKQARGSRRSFQRQLTAASARALDRFTPMRV